MNRYANAHPAGVEARPRWAAGTGYPQDTASPSRHQALAVPPVALAMRKRGRRCIVGKLVTAHPLGRLVFATPYRHRRTVRDFVSIPPLVLHYAREQGVRLWVVRFDGEGRCVALPLADVERRGFLKRSDGKPEHFVPLTVFEPIPWQDWPYTEHMVELGPTPESEQLRLFTGGDEHAG